MSIFTKAIKSILVVLIFFTVTCIEITRASIWNIEWSFFNAQDSSAVNKHLVHEISVIGYSNAQIQSDTFDNIKTLKACIFANGVDEQKFLTYNPKLRVKLWNTSSNIFDTLMTWQEVDFVRGTDPYGNENQNVSKKTFYINTD